MAAKKKTDIIPDKKPVKVKSGNVVCLKTRRNIFAPNEEKTFFEGEKYSLDPKLAEMFVKAGVMAYADN